MRGHAPWWLAFLLLAGNARAGPDPAPLPFRALAADCEETEECFTAGLGLGDDQEQQLRAIQQSARRRQDDLREDTFHRLRDVLAPDQARQLEERRALILEQRAERLRRQADRLHEQARAMRATP